MHSPLIIIFGPTGVGKTDFAEKLARYFESEIVNADLGQFYTPLSIGTAKPDWRSSPIAQHLFDCINEPQTITAMHYRDMALQVCQEIENRNALPLLVGGSGFYIKSLFFAPCKGTVKKEHTLPENSSWELLNQIDPERATQIHPHDKYRIARALDIYYITGKKPSSQAPVYTAPTSFCFIYLTRDKQDLYERINKRTQIMMEQGWIEEVKRLQNTPWEVFLKKRKFIGYDDILNYLEGEKTIQDEDMLIQVITQKTRNYAKRQITFGNRLFEQLEHEIAQSSDTKSSCIRFNLTHGAHELYLEQLMPIIAALKNDKKK